MTTTAGNPPANAHRDELTVLRQRLHRISGQVLGIDKMIAERRPSGEVLIQVAAIQGALRAVALQVLTQHTRTAVGAAATGTRSPTDVTDEITALTNLIVRD